MKKIIAVIFSLILFLPFFAPKAFAASACAATVTNIDSTGQLTVSMGPVDNSQYVYQMNIIGHPPLLTSSIVNGEVIFKINRLPPGNYPFIGYLGPAVYTQANCKQPPILTVTDASQGGTTTVKQGNLTFTPPNPTNKTPIVVTVTNLPIDTTYTAFFYNSDYTADYASQNVQPQLICQKSANNAVSFTTQPFSSGTWGVQITQTPASATTPCSLDLSTLVASGLITISASSDYVTPISIPPAFCAKWIGGKCLEIKTALGSISTDPQGFVRWVFSIVLGLAGGIALILIMLSGYKFMTSQGNPEQLTAARDQLTSAIVGLLFIIFSFVILQVIGVDLLHIPGFTK